MGGGNFYIFKDITDEERVAALDFVKFMTTPANAAKWSIATGYVAPRDDAWETPEMKAYAEKLPAALVARDQIPHAYREFAVFQRQKVTQFLVDAKGDTSFLEISPRMGAAIAVTVPCGFDFPSAGVDLARGLTPDSAYLPNDYPVGITLAWSYGDLAGLIHAMQSGAIGVSESGLWLWSAFRSAITADVHTSWSWADPRPTMATFLAAARKGLAGSHPMTRSTSQ